MRDKLGWSNLSKSLARSDRLHCCTRRQVIESIRCKALEDRYLGSAMCKVCEAPPANYLSLQRPFWRQTDTIRDETGIGTLSLENFPSTPRGSPSLHQAHGAGANVSGTANEDHASRYLHSGNRGCVDTLFGSTICKPHSLFKYRETRVAPLCFPNTHPHDHATSKPLSQPHHSHASRDAQQSAAFT